ncbi:hypothetical protein M413DRAFT_447479 [Hebeloma cylindrosporum]|uniref:Uncharacterized protein n=1 Tax=Hebeloma cylindrosporum TaxID=76867 RepID=A0A0C2YDR0_HEBCY|nr:hypothetical protein M413DRAFT_447479 [Hebeloma cylindrosporum h7]
MLSKQPCRSFFALVCFFLFVVQVVAVPAKAKRPKDLFKNLGYKSSHEAPISVHAKAKFMHIQAHHANIAAARLHEVHAQILSGPKADAHYNAAEHHKAAANGHLRKANKHGSSIANHLAGQHGPKQSAKKATESLHNAQRLYQHAMLGHSLMVAAQEHKLAEAAHGEAALKAEGRGHQTIKNYHLGHKERHGKHASTNASHALEYLNGQRTYSTQPGNDIKAALQSAEDARSSKKMAHVTIQDHR